MDKNMRKPSLRFKGFTDDWEQRDLLKVARYRNGKAHENEIDETGQYIVVNSKFVSTDGEIKKFTNYMIEPLYENELAFVLSDVPNGKAIARTFLIKNNDMYSLNQRIAGITPNENTHPYFLSILMNRNKYFLSFDDGAKQTNLSKSDVEKFESFYPVFQEQAKIGVLFENLDSLITLHQRKYDKLVNIKKSLLEKMFPQNGESIPRLRFKGFTDAWEQCKLSQFYDFSKGKGLSLNSFYEGKDSLGIAYGHLYTKYTEVINKVNLSTYDDNGVLSRKGDLLFPGSSTVPFGTAQSNAIMLDNVKLGGDVIIARAKDLSVYAPFVSYQINAQRSKLFPIIVGTTITHMYGKDIANIEYMFPKFDEQEKIGRTLESLDSLITLHQRKYEKLQNIKKALLQKMFV